MVSFENTDPIGFLFTGFERKKEAVGMVLADIFKAALHGLEPDSLFPAAFTCWFFGHDHLLFVFSYIHLCNFISSYHVRIQQVHFAVRITDPDILFFPLDLLIQKRYT